MSRLKIMPRLNIVLAVLAAIGFTCAIAMPAANAGGGGGSGSCNVLDPSCTVGTGGGDGNGGGDAGGSGSSGDPCAKYPNAAYGSKPPAVSQVCADELQANFCKSEVADAADGLEKPPAQWTAAETEAVNRGLRQMGCPPVITPAGLAQEAVKTIVFPKPSGERSPSPARLYQGFPFTYVNLWTFFWTSRSTWKTLTATASAAGLSATVTAKPVELDFDPGDGSPGVSCPGPGRPWVPSDGNGAPTDGACAYQYARATPGPITSTQTIVWKITWKGTGGSSGEISSLSTSVSGQLQVLQIQTVTR